MQGIYTKKGKMKIGIDIGGTKINAILLDEKGNIKRKVKLPTQKSKILILKQVSGSIQILLSGNKVDRIGIAVPGILDKRKEKIIALPNIKGFENFALKHFIEKKFKIKTKLENDSLCSALAEYHFIGKKPESLVVLTIGAGLGGGVIINGKPLGRTEPGHITIERKGARDSCGNYGCLEQYASKKFLVREARKQRLPSEPKKLAEIAKNNKKARTIFQEFGKNLGIGLSDIVKLIDPEIIIISGGIANSSQLFLKYAINELNTRTFFMPRAKILVSKNIENASAIGAALL